MSEIGHLRSGTPIGAWLLKAHRDVWDVVGAMRAGEPIDSWPLVASYRLEMMAPGQRCVLWLTGSDRDDPPPGIYAAGVTTGVPEVRLSDEDRLPRPHIDVELTVLRTPILRSELWADPRFECTEIRVAGRVSSPGVLTPTEVAAIADQMDGVPGW